MLREFPASTARPVVAALSEAYVQQWKSFGSKDDVDNDECYIGGFIKRVDRFKVRSNEWSPKFFCGSQKLLFLACIGSAAALPQYALPGLLAHAPVLHAPIVHAEPAVSIYYTKYFIAAITFINVFKIWFLKKRRASYYL